MRSYFWVIIFIINILLSWMPVDGTELPRTPSRLFVHERKKTLENIPKPTNKWVDFISQISDEDTSKKIDLLRILEWDAYYHPETRKDLPIYEHALSGLKQKNFDFGNISPGEKTIPILSSHFNVASIENDELKNKTLLILKDMHKVKVDNFDHRINYYTQEIQKKLNDLRGKPILAAMINPLIDGLIAQQLEKIQEKANFTHDKILLKKDLDILSPYKSHMREKNAILLEQLEKIATQIQEIGFPITEPAPEEEFSSSSPREKLPEPKTSESELQIIPYQESPFEKLLKMTEPKNPFVSAALVKKSSSSSSSSSTSQMNTPFSSPLPTPPLSPRQGETIPIEDLQVSTPEPYQITEAPSQATQGDDFEELEPLVIPDNPIDEAHPLLLNDVEELVVENIPRVEPTAIPDVNTPASNPSEETQTPPTSGLWDSWLMKKILAFFNNLFWNLYGYR